MWPAKLTPWLRKVCLGSGEGVLTRLELRQVVHGSADSMVESWTFNEDTPKTDVEVFAGEITARAQADCEEAFDGPTQYTVLAFFDGNEFHGTRAPTVRFASPGRSTEGSGFDESEPASPKGFAAQQMRHNEGLVRMLVANTTSMQHHTERLLERAYARIHHLEEDRYKLIATQEGALSEQKQREMFEAHEREKLVRYQDAWQQAKVLFPTLVNKVTGRNLMTEKTTPATEIVQELLASLSPEQTTALQGILTPPQLVGFASLYEEAAKKHEARKAEMEEQRANAVAGKH